MLRFVEERPEHAAVLDRVRAWTRERFALADDAAILVSEVSCRSRCCTSGFDTARMISRFIFSTMSLGSPAGPEIVNQVVATRSIPISLKVGTSGKSGRRLACECTIALRVPARTCAADEDTVCAEKKM